MASSYQDLPVSGSEVRSELDSLNSSDNASPPARITPNKRVRVRERFSCWSFHFTFSADSTALNGGVATGCVILRERQTLLNAHIRSRVVHKMPSFVTFVTAFYDTSIISGALPAGVSLSISLRGYVQTRTNTNCEITSVQKWIPDAIWNPVRGGLASNAEFKSYVSQSEDPNDPWTQMIVYGGLSLNNPARLERKQMREASHLH